ncbi:hypothetical protein PU629_21210 [Pullulanibacillus sp. KACC 23026]|uniref:hypothetical protein n=1 Tax=Pullulanibacillus sp. KACC 23026 TaxID=3028315 RepID=UPI0023B15D16|nr:hypothetical protein [Pullulanibacillus sp. KACC 23026]WEG12576.1 hypothetical protein PU629_21210 [Pullulanibacillus sp. KACC 23026]
MKNSKFFLLAILALPWLSIPLLGKKNFINYLPAAIFMCTFTKALDNYGETKKWWKFYKGIPPFNSMNFFNFGPYLISSLWMLRLGYRKLILYFISNIILHICFIYLGGLKFVHHFKLFSLKRLTKRHYLGIDILRALVLYGFQSIIGLSGKRASQFYK